MKEPKLKKAKVEASKPTRQQEIQTEIDEHIAKWKGAYNQKASLELTMLHMGLVAAVKANV